MHAEVHECAREARVDLDRLAIREHRLLEPVRVVVDEAVHVVDAGVLLRGVALEHVVEHELGGVVLLLVIERERDERGGVEAGGVDLERLTRLAQRGVRIRRRPRSASFATRGAGRPAPWPARIGIDSGTRSRALDPLVAPSRATVGPARAPPPGSLGGVSASTVVAAAAPVRRPAGPFGCAATGGDRTEHPAPPIDARAGPVCHKHWTHGDPSPGSSWRSVWK